MKITFLEAQELGIWQQIAEISGINEWAVNEGLLDENEILDVEVLKDKTGEIK